MSRYNFDKLIKKENHEGRMKLFNLCKQYYEEDKSRNHPTILIGVNNFLHECANEINEFPDDYPFDAITYDYIKLYVDTVRHGWPKALTDIKNLYSSTNVDEVLQTLNMNVLCSVSKDGSYNHLDERLTLYGSVYLEEVDVVSDNTRSHRDMFDYVIIMYLLHRLMVDAWINKEEDVRTKVSSDINEIIKMNSEFSFLEFLVIRGLMVDFRSGGAKSDRVMEYVYGYVKDNLHKENRREI